MNELTHERLKKRLKKRRKKDKGLIKMMNEKDKK